MRYQTEKKQAQRTEAAPNMRGKIVSIVSNYGFIRDVQGVSYYFNPKRMDSTQPYSDLKTGMTVEFAAKAGPKGMIAMGVKAVQMYEGIQFPRQILSLRNGKKLRDGEQCDEDSLVYVQSAWHRAPNDAMNELMHVVGNADANLAGNIVLHKNTFSEGNYNYTMHSFSAWCGHYWKTFYTDNEQEALKSKSGKQDRIDDSAMYLAHEAKRLQLVRERQEANPLAGFIMAVIIAVAILAVLAAIGA